LCFFSGDKSNKKTTNTQGKGLIRMETATPLVGIDLGTSNSAVAWFNDGRAALIADGQQRLLTPSVVGLDDEGHLIVGEAAKARLVSHPTLTHASFKRYMGTDKIFALGEHRFRAEELSALVLRKLKADAEVKTRGKWRLAAPSLARSSPSRPGLTISSVKRLKPQAIWRGFRLNGW